MPRVHLVISLLKRWLMGPTRVRSVRSTSTTIWMSSRSASIGGDRKAAANSSSVSRSRLWPLIPSLTTASFTRPQRRARANHNLLGSPESRGYPAREILVNVNDGCVIIGIDIDRRRVGDEHIRLRGRLECGIDGAQFFQYRRWGTHQANCSVWSKMLQDDFRTLGQLEGHNCCGIRRACRFTTFGTRAIAPTGTSIC